MTKTTLKIDGMMCGHCEAHVNDTVRNNFAVKKVESSHKKGTTEIISEEPIDVDKLKAAIEKDGYKVMSSESEPYVKKGFSLFK
ncbi:MAG: cation transporter [Ruminococcus sp.]|nr:cation transporter [Ruminococcus sp.]